MTTKFKFAEGEKVLCFHGPLIYEAKALKYTVTKEKQIKYYIHYAGWNKNWDEWVPENRVLKYNDANVQRQKEVFKQHSSSAKNKKGATKGKKNDSSTAGKDSGGVSSGGSESRASTPSKDLSLSTSLVAPTTSRSSNRSKNSSTPVGNKSEDSSRKDDSKDESSKDSSKDEPPKKKRVTSTTNSGSDKPSTSNNNNNNNTSTTSSNASATSTSTSSSTTGNKSTPNMVAATQLLGDVESEESYQNNPEVKIKIPDELKQCLADDWDAVTRQHKLHTVPSKITVQDIVDQYIASRKGAKSSNNVKAMTISETCNGIVEYFNVMLGSQLLYKFERPQYATVMKQHDNTPLSKLYGPFHLLRLFIKLGSMLGYSALDPLTLSILLAQLQEFLKFLVKNSATFFNMNCFTNASPEYHRNSQ